MLKNKENEEYNTMVEIIFKICTSPTLFSNQNQSIFPSHHVIINLLYSLWHVASDQDKESHNH